MKLITLTICTAAMLFGCNNEKTAYETVNEGSATSDSVTTDKEKAWVPVDSATAMKAWMEYAKPGEPHKILAQSNGTWQGDVTMWMSMDAAPSKSTSTIINKMVMDGRYQVSSFNGNFMGMPFEGMSTTGYDNFKKIFISTWIDNMGTGIMKMEGPWDETTRSMTLTGKMTDPSTGRECDMKEVFKIIDANTQVMEMYGPDPKTGKQYKTMEVKYSRKK
ncbi:MAG TPA: DUF1579 domain-containing protein [Chitinophagaceae bacterium]|nr:DUF1579 domain-containing protein [Chitinophagaceae bacterium]